MVSKASEPIVPPVVQAAEAGAVAKDAPRKLGMFASLGIRDYKLLWWGMVISNVGTWMQMVAQGYLVYQMTHSPFALGLVGFVRAIPVFIFSLFAGVIADRVDRRKLLIVTQSLAGILAFALAVLTSTGIIQVWMIMVIAFISAAVMSFDNPTRQALIPDIVGKEYIANAVALNSAAFNGTGVLGPSLAGATLGIIGIAACFYINAISFLAVIIALFMMSPVAQRSVSKHGMWRNLRDGFTYVRGNRLVAALLVQIALICLFGRPYTQLMPAVQHDVLHVGAGGLGMLMAFSGLGALIGALVVARLSDFEHRGLLLLCSLAAMSVALVGFASSRIFTVSLILLVVVGGGATIAMSTTNTMIQLGVPDALRGRVMSMYTMIMMGGMPLGSMILGALASGIGVPQTLALGGIACLVAIAAVNFAVPAVRRPATA